jgi:CspA family cold shock protein
MASGTVKWFDPNRGYGFIRPEHGEDVFVHLSAVQASGLQHLRAFVRILGKETRAVPEVPEDRVRLRERTTVVEHDRRHA